MIQNIEMVRWDYHNKVILPQAKCMRKPSDSMDIWWKERAAFIAVMPRKSGKTEIIRRVAETIDEPYEIIIPSLKMIKEYTHRRKMSGITTMRVIRKKVMSEEIDVSNTNIFIDEFQRIPGDDMNFILSLAWKSVNMFGTMV